MNDIIRKGYDFHIGEYISKGFDLVWKNPGGFVLYSFLALFMIMLAAFIPVIGTIALMVLSPALMGGIYLYAQKLDEGERPDFQYFFKGFDFIGPLAMVAVVSTIIISLSAVPFFIGISSSGFFSWYMDLLSDPSASDLIDNIPSFPFWYIILLFIPLYFNIAYSWAPLFVIFYGYSFWDALETSRKLLTKRWFMIFLFSIIIGFITLFGYFLLLVGILFTFPAALCMNYSAFADVTKMGKEENEENILDHLVE